MLLLAVAARAPLTVSFRTDLAGIGAASANLPTILSDCAYRFHASDIWLEGVISAVKSRLITSHSRVES